MTKDIVKVAPGQVGGTALEVYADKNLIIELTSRLMDFHPAAEEVGKPGMLMAAQLAVLMGASPLPGTNEIHIWRDNRGVNVVTPGINYWRRRAAAYGGVFWDFEARPMSAAERDIYGIPQQFLAAICRGVPEQKILFWIKQGLSYEQALKSFGVTGIGTVKQGEQLKMGRPLIWSAIKRSQTDFYKQAFPYVPGEQAMAAGPGMKITAGGNYAPDYALEWGSLDLSLDERTFDSDGDSLTLDETNEMLYGFNNDDDPPIEGEVEDVTEDEPAVEDVTEDEPAVDVEEEEDQEVPLIYGNGRVRVDQSNAKELKAFINYVEIEGKKPQNRIVLREWTGHPATTPGTAEDTREMLIKKAHNGYQGLVTDNEKQLKYVSASLSKVFPNKLDRKAALNWLFEKTSNVLLTGGQANALIDWIGANEENGYTVSAQVKVAAARIITAALIAQGQMLLDLNGNASNEEE